MLIKGLQKTTLIDYPGKIACTVFLFGCNFRCHYCHNPELVNPSPATDTKIFTEGEIFQFLTDHQRMIEGVCISGGEPTLNADLPDFIRKIKRIGYYSVKLDTNGTNPDMLQKLLDEKIVDYVAMDFKAPLERYMEVTDTYFDIEILKKSVKIVKQFPQYEFRATVLPRLISKDDLLKIAVFLQQHGATNKFTIQQFQNRKCLDQSFERIKTYSDDELKEFQRFLQSYFKKVDVRD
jgi:pyruvate formate lyase activating enzyme